MHSQRNRWIQQGGELIACAMGRNSFTRVHGGKHVSGPENQEQHAGNDQRHEDKEIGECSDLHVSEPLAWVVVEESIKHRQRGFNQPGHGVGEVVHSHLRLAALWRLALDKLRPDSRPVVGAEVLTRYRAFGGLLDLHAAFNWDGPIALSPLADSRLPNAKGFRQMSLATKGLNGFVDCVHEHQYRHYRCSAQVHCL